VVRHFVFSGDTRRFAVLGRRLPLEAPDVTAPQERVW
jgi:hypothetical protein